MTIATNRLRINERLTRAAALCLLAFAAVLCQAREAAAQWTAPDAAGNISTTNTGNVGVGTAAPTEKLEVNGTLKATGHVAIGAGGAVNQAPYASPTTLMRSLLDARETVTDLTTATQYNGLVPTLILNPAANAHSGSIARGLISGVMTATGNPYNVYNLFGGMEYVIHKGTGIVNTTAGSQVSAQNTSSGTITSAKGLHSIVLNTSSGLITSAAGLDVWAGNTAGGNITTAIGGKFSVTNGSGAITTGYGVQILPATNAGTFTNNYGLHIADQSAVGSANSFNLYSDGANAKNYFAGSVGVGTTAPAAKLHVAGDIRVDGNINAKYQDVAEWVPSTQKLAAGTVVVLDTGRDNHVAASLTSYDTRVAGVISAQPGIALGDAGEGKALVATTGRVKVKVDATRGPISVGDLLVTSDRPGYAMRSEPVLIGKRQFHSPGTIIGKALQSLAGGTGEILVLLSLQ